MHRGQAAAFAAGVLCWTLCGSTAWGQSREAAAGPAVGVRAMIHSVANLEKTVAFYHDGLGLELTSPGASSKKLAAPSALDESLSRFTDTHGAKFRNASFKIPGAAFGLELTEFTGTKRMAVQPHMQDPGAGTLVLVVRDVGKALAGVKANGGTVLSLGGRPGKVGGENSKSLSVFVRDPDGFLLELAHIDPIPATTASASSNVIGARIGLTIANTDQTIKFYHEGLGFETKPGSSFTSEKTIASLIDAQGAQWRINMAKVPGTQVDWEMIEFKDIARRPYHPRVPDTGAPAVSVFVKDVPEAMKSVVANGGSIVTAGGTPVKIGNGQAAFVRDPNGFLLELINMGPQR